jgi:hypothetical protein
VISIAAGGPALSDLALIIDVEGARSTPDEGVRGDLILLTAPPQIATVNQIGALTRDRDFIKRYLSGDLEATAKMKTLHAAAHRQGATL